MPAIRLSTSSRAISVLPASTGSRSPCADTVSLAGIVPATPAAPTRMRLPLAPSRQPSIRPNSRIHAAAVIGGTSVHVAAGNHGTPGRRAQLEKHQRKLAFSGASADCSCPRGRSCRRCAMKEDVERRRTTLGSTPALDRGPPVAYFGIRRSPQCLLAGSTIGPIGPRLEPACYQSDSPWRRQQSAMSRRSASPSKLPGKQTLIGIQESRFGFPMLQRASEMDKGGRSRPRSSMRGATWRRSGTSGRNGRHDAPARCRTQQSRTGTSHLGR